MGVGVGVVVGVGVGGCGCLGGKLYLGICLKSQRVDQNADTIPFKCNPYVV